MSVYLGYLALAVSLVVILGGLPMQIFQNFRRKSCEGLSLPLMALVFVAYSIWAAYGLSKADWFLVCSQTPGAILTLVILAQFAAYGRTEKTNASAEVGKEVRRKEIHIAFLPEWAQRDIKKALIRGGQFQSSRDSDSVQVSRGVALFNGKIVQL